MKLFDKKGAYSKYLTTKTLGMAIPAIVEEYGEGKIDVKFVLSQEKINKILPNV